MTAGFTVEALSPAHQRKGFDSGSPPLDRYLAELAGQDSKRRVSNCFVLSDETGATAGYYTLAAASIPMMDLPDEDTKRLPRYALLPAALIGRLAVDRRFQGRGLGSALIIDAVHRAGRADPAVFTLIVDAKDNEAIAFYRRFGFKRFAARPMTLYLPIATALEALRGDARG